MNQKNHNESFKLSRLEGLQQKLQLYRESNDLADTALMRLENGQIAQQYLDQINQKMVQIEQLDQTALAAGNEQESDQTTGLRQVKQELQQAIESLIEKTNKLESMIRTARENLLPKLNDQLVASKMQQAYSSNNNP